MWTRVKDYDKDSVIVFWNYLEFDDLHVAKNRNPHRDGHNPNRHDEVPSQEQLFLVGNINSGRGDGTKTDEFSEKFQRGGGRGGHFNPKTYIADFGPLNKIFWPWNLKKKLQFDFPKMRGVKGRLEFSRKFIRFGTVTRPSAIMKLENEVQKIYSIGDWENLIMLLHKKTINKLIQKLHRIRLLWLRAKIQYYQ